MERTRNQGDSLEGATDRLQKNRNRCTWDFLAKINVLTMVRYLSSNAISGQTCSFDAELRDVCLYPAVDYVRNDLALTINKS